MHLRRRLSRRRTVWQVSMWHVSCMYVILKALTERVVILSGTRSVMPITKGARARQNLVVIQTLNKCDGTNVINHWFSWNFEIILVLLVKKIVLTIIGSLFITLVVYYIGGKLFYWWVLHWSNRSRWILCWVLSKCILLSIRLIQFIL